MGRHLRDMNDRSNLLLFLNEYEWHHIYKSVVNFNYKLFGMFRDGH